jgi:hypothetical protein
MAETIYPKGIRTFAKHDKAPDFILGSVIISLNEFFKWVKENPELQTEYDGNKQLKLTCMTKKGGGITFSVDTYKPTAKTEPQQSATPHTDAINNEAESDDLPFN